MSLVKRVSVDTLLRNSFFVNMTKISIWENFQPNLSSFKLFCSDLAWSTDECFYAWFSWGVLHYFFPSIFKAHTHNKAPLFYPCSHMFKMYNKNSSNPGRKVQRRVRTKTFFFLVFMFQIQYYLFWLPFCLSVCLFYLHACLSASIQVIWKPL